MPKAATLPANPRKNNEKDIYSMHSVLSARHLSSFSSGVQILSNLLSIYDSGNNPIRGIERDCYGCGKNIEMPPVLQRRI